MWKNKTCETCNYRVDRVCRKYPPTNVEIYWYKSYPEIQSNESLAEVEFLPACSEYEKT